MADQAFTGDQRADLHDQLQMSREQRQRAWQEQAAAAIARYLAGEQDERRRAQVAAARALAAEYLAAIYEIAFLDAVMVDMLEDTWPQLVQHAVSGEAQMHVQGQVLHVQQWRQQLEQKVVAFWATAPETP